MCYLDSVLGEGPALVYQGITLLSIAASITIWAFTLRREGMDLSQYLAPIALWTATGSLDILITVVGAFGDPMREGNLGARIIFKLAGDFGPAMASILWISLWSLAILAIHRTGSRFSKAMTLLTLYCLAAGHLLGFSSWYDPLCAYSSAVHSVFVFPFEPLSILIGGLALTMAHLTLIGMVKTFQGQWKGGGSI